jgi:hypothetical protein
MGVLPAGRVILWQGGLDRRSCEALQQAAWGFRGSRELLGWTVRLRGRPSASFTEQRRLEQDGSTLCGVWKLGQSPEKSASSASRDIGIITGSGF